MIIRAPDTDGFATLIVGSKQHRFSIPSDILIAISHYFETALTRGFREDHSQTITWEDQSPALAERFQRWIYSYSILTSSETIEEIGWALLLDMYIFGEMYDVPSLQNTVIDAYIDKGEETEQFPASWLHKIYEITPRRCMLRKFLLDAASASRLKAWFNTEEKRAAYPREFLFDLIIKETDGKKPNRDFRDLRTDYHVRNEYTDRVRVRRRTIPEFLPDPPHGPERAAEEGEIEQDE